MADLNHLDNLQTYFIGTTVNCRAKSVAQKIVAQKSVVFKKLQNCRAKICHRTKMSRKKLSFSKTSRTPKRRCLKNVAMDAKTDAKMAGDVKM
jgi:hypothetical protein